jgi:tetratricopeptide (TPR) repeat protein
VTATLNVAMLGATGRMGRSIVPLVLAASAELLSGSDLYDSKAAECQSAFGIGDTSRAEVLCQEAYRLAAGNNLRMARIGNTLGTILTSTGRYAEAEGFLVRSQRLLRSEQGGYSADLVVVLSAQAALYILQWRPEPASKLLDEAAEIASRVNAPPVVVAYVCRETAQLHLIRGRLDESRNGSTVGFRTTV